MNPDANNETPGDSFDFDSAEQQFEGVELPTLELGPADRLIVQQLESGFETMELGLRHTLGQVEKIRAEADFDEIMRDPEKAARACEFMEILPNLPQGLALTSMALHAASHALLGYCSEDDLPEAS